MQVRVGGLDELAEDQLQEGLSGGKEGTTRWALRGGTGAVVVGGADPSGARRAEALAGLVTSAAAERTQVSTGCTASTALLVMHAWARSVPTTLHTCAAHAARARRGGGTLGSAVRAQGLSSNVRCKE